MCSREILNQMSKCLIQILDRPGQRFVPATKQNSANARACAPLPDCIRNRIVMMQCAR